MKCEQMSFDRLKQIVVKHVPTEIKHEIEHASTGIGLVKLQIGMYLESGNPVGLGDLMKDLVARAISVVENADVRCLSDILRFCPMGRDPGIPGWTYRCPDADLEETEDGSIQTVLRPSVGRPVSWGFTTEW